MNNAGKNTYEKLTIRDKFMFGKVTKNPEIARKMADLLIPVEIGAVTAVEREKFLQHRSTSKYVKLDMYLEDENGRVIDTEMQNKSQNKIVQEELPLRVRYYQGMIDQEIKRARLNEDWRAEYLKTYVNDMDMRREGYIEGEISKEKELINRWLKKGKAIAEIADDLGKSEDYIESLLNS